MGKNKIKKLLIIILLPMFFSCVRKKDLDLEILNQEIVTYSKENLKDTINVIRFYIKNNTNQLYFINGSQNGGYYPKGINKTGITLKVFDSNNKEVEYYFKRQPQYNENDCILSFINNYDIYKNKYLGYKGLKYNYFKMNNLDKSFFLFPEETLFFEYSVCLSNVVVFDDDRNNYVSLDKNGKYYAKILLTSDNSLYKSSLPWDVLKSIEVNKAEVFNGLIESKNKVNVRVLD